MKAPLVAEGMAQSHTGILGPQLLSDRSFRVLPLYLPEAGNRLMKVLDILLASRHTIRDDGQHHYSEIPCIRVVPSSVETLNHVRLLPLPTTPIPCSVSFLILETAGSSE